MEGFGREENLLEGRRCHRQLMHVVLQGLMLEKTVDVPHAFLRRQGINMCVHVTGDRLEAVDQMGGGGVWPHEREYVKQCPVCSM